MRLSCLLVAFTVSCATAGTSGTNVRASSAARGDVGAASRAPVVVLYHRDLGHERNVLGREVPEVLPEAVWVDAKTHRLRLMLHRGDDGPATLETIDWAASRTLDTRQGTLGQIVNQAQPVEPCRRLPDGRRLEQDGDHVDLVSPDGASQRVDDVHAAYGPCFVGEGLAAWTSWLAPAMQYDLVAMDLATRTKHHVADTTGIDTPLEVSPDGSALVAVVDRRCIVRVDAVTLTATRLACVDEKSADRRPMLLVSPSWKYAALVSHLDDTIDGMCSAVWFALPGGERRGEGRTPCFFLEADERRWNGLLGDDGLLLLATNDGVTVMAPTGRAASLRDGFYYDVDRAVWRSPGDALVPRQGGFAFELVALDARALLQSAVR